MAKVAGIINIKVDGQLIRSEPGATMNYGGITRQEIISGKNVDYQESFAAGKIEASVPMVSGISLEDMRSWVDKTVVFETDIGVSFLFTNMFTTSAIEMSDGKVKLAMAGDAGVQQ
jgi:hypothetical protein